MSENQKSYRKPFSQEIYNETDPIAKSIVRQIFEHNGFKVFIEPVKYGIDIIIGDPKIMGIELEVKDAWQTFNYPFPDMHILQRKDKYLNDAKNFFWIFNRFYTRYAIVNVLTVAMHEPVGTPNKYAPGDEELMRWVPVNKLKFGTVDYNFVKI